MDWDALISITLHILGVVVLVLLNGFFVAAEFSLVKVRDTQLSPLVRQGHRRAQVADFILQPARLVPERGATGHHADEPGPGLDRQTGLRRAVATGLRPAERGLAGNAGMPGVHHWLLGDHLPAHQRGGTGAQMAGHSEAAGDDAVDFLSLAVVLPRVLSICGGAQLVLAVDAAPGRASSWPARRAGRIPRRSCACCWRRRKSRPAAPRWAGTSC